MVSADNYSIQSLKASLIKVNIKGMAATLHTASIFVMYPYMNSKEYFINFIKLQKI